MQVRLLSASTALWIRNLTACHVFALPVKGSVYARHYLWTPPTPWEGPHPLTRS